jgi:NitT/TauT family transport system permease protein
MAAVFLIFTSQAWNMALGVYESVKTIPNDSNEALEAFGVAGWLRFKRLLMPASVPKLVYNSILSWVAGWYFLIACEIITVGPSDYRLPGLGSFLMQSADKGRTGELIAGLLALLSIIVAMDLLLWQPLSAWSEKFRYEFAASAEPMRSLALADLVGSFGSRFSRGIRALMRPVRSAFRTARDSIPRSALPLGPLVAARWRRIRVVVGVAAGAYAAYLLVLAAIALTKTLAEPWPSEVRQIPVATLASLARLLAAYAISLAWTLPCALAASESPRFNRLLAPMAEIAGSMPATALFPLIVIFVIKVTGGMNLASVLLILTGMQWYLLFNLLAGVRQIPEDLKEAARAYGLSRAQTWAKLVIPALIPSLITGSITAWGGGWNALILSEWFVYKGEHYQVTGLGALLDQATYVSGNGVMILLSLMSMVLVVVGLNRVVWRRLYNYATEHYRLDY